MSKKISGPGFMMKFSEEGDPSLPDGEKSIFSNMNEALEIEEMQEARMEQGCLEAHIELYYELHQERLVDQWNEESTRFINGQCQNCGSTEGYREEIERCAACAIKDGWTL